MLQWTQRCIYLFELMFSFSLDKYLGVELLNHIVVLFLIFWGNSIPFFKWLYPFTLPLTVYKDPFCLQSCEHLLFAGFLIIAILRSVSWYLIVIVICISLIVNDIEHLFICLLAIYMSSFEKCLLMSSVHFFFFLRKVTSLLKKKNNFIYSCVGSLLLPMACSFWVTPWCSVLASHCSGFSCGP